MGLFFRRYKTRLNLGEKEIKRTLFRRLTWILGIVTLHAVAFAWFESVSFGEALWVTVTTLTTVGYGDLSATTAFGQVSTTVLCFLVGIPVLASVWDAYASWRDSIRDQKRAGLYQWDLKGHILIVSYPRDYSPVQMVRLVRAIRTQKSLAKLPIQILTRRFDGDYLPQELIDLGNIAHVNGLASSKQTLALANADKASHIIVLRDAQDNDPEGHSFNICARIRDVNKTASITVQVNDPHSRSAQRLNRAGATNLLRPVKAYPEIISLSLITHGVSDVFEDLLTVDGTEFRLIPYKGRVRWRDIQALAGSKDYGTPIGVQTACTTPAGRPYTQPILAPDPDFEDNVEGIYVISRKNNGTSFTDRDWQQLLGHDSDDQTPPCSVLYLFNLPVNQACPQDYLSSLLYQLRSTRKYADSQILAISEQIPDALKDAVEQADPDSESGWIWRNVKLVERVPSDLIFEEIEAGSFQYHYDAQSVIAILNNDADTDPDGYTYELIDLLRMEGDYQGIIVAEADSDSERERLYVTGADFCLRPVRGYPGMLARTLTNPGVEKAIEALFRFNDLKILRIPVTDLLPPSQPRPESISFGEIKRHLRRRSQGTIPLSVRHPDSQGEVICPSTEETFPVTQSTILVLSREA